MRVLIFGASSAQGFWDSQGGWADRLKHHYDNLQIQDIASEQPRVMNLGVSGDSTTEILKRIEPEARLRQNEKGLAFIIQIGSNNAVEESGQLRSSTEDYQSDLSLIIEKARQFSDKILVIGFPAVDEKRTNPIPWREFYYKNENIYKFEQAAKSTCEKLTTPFVYIHEQFKKKMDAGTEMQAWDGLHPNDKGHRLIFELVRPELDKLLDT